MKRNLFGVLASVAMAGTLVAAQGSPSSGSSSAPSPSSSPSQQPSMPSASERQQNVTVTGCLIQGSNADTFLLENAKVSAGSASASSARPSSESSSQPGASSPSMSSVASVGQTYVIEGATSLNLKTQVNHQVTIIGTVASAAGSSIGSPSSAGSGYGSPGSIGSNPGNSAGGVSSSSSSPTSAHHDESKLARLTAKSVAKISDTCSSAD